MQGSKRVCEKPQDWDKAVSAAYLWLLGATKEKVASGVGVDVTTIYRWTASEWWLTAEHEAMSRWLHDLRADVANRLPAFVRTDPTTARWAAERLIDALAPPTQRHEVKQEVDVNVHDVREELTSRIARLAARN
jgi:hypothetical protein